ncbi:helix-turn-helix domain-containing protein [Variovorax robiniae]|uniref:Helix-turn-helix domain-containing protein n=1 Tax=Variovorax robiniae TaxID=1836199 RepID=A0ABU8X779_9BURK
MPAQQLHADATAQAAAIRYARTLTRDAGEHAASLSAWDQNYEQLSAGRYEGCLEEFHIGPVQIFREQSNQSVMQGGRPRANTISVALAEANRAPGWYCGHQIDEGGIFAISSDREFELVAGAGMALVGVCVDTAELVKRAAILHGRDLELTLPGTSMVGRSTAHRHALAVLVDSAMSLVRDRPKTLADAAVRNRLAESLTDAVLDSIAPERLESGLLPGAAARRQIVATAREYMRSHADEPISVPDLCVATGASRRALQYAFENVVQLSPVTYLRVMRLNRVRSELQSRHGDTVGDVAARWGFWHPSRFAAEYRELFGELPSATRTRFALHMPLEAMRRH